MDREKVLDGKSQREQLELKVHWALSDLSDYFKLREDPLYYELNRVWRDFDHIRDVPNFPIPAHFQ